MNVFITGAQGYVGRGLVARLLADGRVGNHTIERLTLLDHSFADAPQSLLTDARVKAIAGNLTDQALVRAAVADADLVFHLASVPGGAATRDFGLGISVNLTATIDLFESIRLAGRRPRVVFASTVGVFGSPLPAVVTEDTLPTPFMSYGAHKLASEVLLADYSKREFFDGVALRLPGIVARPREPSGLLTAFLSNLIRDLSAGKHFVCPVGADGRSWLMSRPCLIDNLLHAATMSAEALRQQRVFLLPVQHVSMAEMVEALAQLHGPAVRDLISYQPDAALHAQFARYPPMQTPRARAAGFVSDDSVKTLVARALD